jgi:hypothetical protein
MRVCLYRKCNNEFEPVTRKQMYCCSNCRKYASKENKDILNSSENEIEYLVTFSGTKIKFQEKYTDLILAKLGVSLKREHENVLTHKINNAVITSTSKQKESSIIIEEDDLGDEYGYDYYYKKVLECKDPIVTQYEREDLSKEISRCKTLDKKQKDFLINSLKN